MPAGHLLANDDLYPVLDALAERAFLRGAGMPFLFGIGLLVVGLFIRLQIYESPLFEKSAIASGKRASPSSRSSSAIRETCAGDGGALAENGRFYVFSVFVLSYATAALNVPRTAVLNGVLIASARNSS